MRPSQLQSQTTHPGQFSGDRPALVSRMLFAGMLAAGTLMVGAPGVAGAAASNPAAAATAAPSAPTLVLINGHVITMDAGGTLAEAVAVSGDRIVAVGPTTVIKALSGAGTRIIDLEGRTLLPGFIDSRIHGPFGFWELSFAAALVQSDGSPMSRPEAIETRMTQWIAEHKPAAGEWIVAAGFNPKLAVVRGFDKTFADRIAADNPLLLLSLDHRVAVMNSKAIDLCRPEAEPNGLVREGAVFLLMNRVWSLQPDAVRRDATERFGQAASRFGITTVGSPMMVPADLQTAEAMIAEGRMPVRLVAGALGANAPARTAFAEYNDARKSPEPERVSI